MNEQPSKKPNQQELSVDCIRYLQYSLAGDFESAELLNQLFERLKTIQWDDPAFVAMCEQVRGRSSQSPLEDNDKAQLLSMAHFLIERDAQREEMASASIPQLKKAMENFGLMDKFNKELFSYVHIITDLHLKMRDHLEMLHADVSLYEFPKLPELPDLQ